MKFIFLSRLCLNGEGRRRKEFQSLEVREQAHWTQKGRYPSIFIKESLQYILVTLYRWGLIWEVVNDYRWLARKQCGIYVRSYLLSEFCHSFLSDYKIINYSWKHHNMKYPLLCNRWGLIWERLSMITDGWLESR